MYKITKKFEDYLGEDHEESFRFNITVTEMLDLIKDDPSFHPDNLMALMKEPNGLKIVDVVRKLLVISYGVLSDDAKRFVKDNETTTAFVQSAAFEEIFSDFIDGKHEKLVKEFIQNVFPKKYKDAIQKRQDELKIAAISTVE